MSKRVAFLGSKFAGLQLCKALCDGLPKGGVQVIICPDDSFDLRSVFNDFLMIGQKYEIPVHVSSDRKSTLALLDFYEITHAFVLGWYQIISVGRGRQFYGFHYSPLPKYRGNAPLVWQIINGEPEIGISFFSFSDGMDEGDVIAQSYFKLDISESINDALEKANREMLDIINSQIPLFLSDELTFKRQAHDLATYGALRTPEDGRIDWHMSATQIHNFIRAQTLPYPGAFSYLPDGKRVYIWKSEIEQRGLFGVPGGVAEVRDDYVVIACGSGAVRVVFATVEGTQDLSLREIFKSLKIRLK